MKLYLQTFGCRANQYDSGIVRALAAASGVEVVDDVAVADLAVFNSCAVTAQAERDVRKAVRGAAAKNPRLRSVIMGCAAALPASIPALRALPTVRGVVAGANLDDIADALGLPRTAALPSQQPTVRANLRIQDGCDEHCTFCATTVARGANRSRDVRALLAEGRALAEQHPEIVITGTHIGSYGLDTGTSLGALMQRLVRDVPDVRFRLSSLEATEVDDALLELFSEPRRLAPHLHAPLQSGSDRVLKRMGRHWYTAASYARAVKRVADRVAVFGLGADVIAGFPGETDDDFEATLALVDALPFTYLHVFSYSRRPGTAATKLPDEVTPAVTHERVAQLRSVAAAKTAAHRAARSGGSADAIVVSASPREAVTEDFLTVSVHAPIARGTRCDGTLRAEGDALVLDSLS